MKKETTRQKALKELKSIWELCNKLKTDGVEYNRDDWFKMTYEERYEILSLLDYMKKYDWIELQQGALGWPMSISPTSIGIDMIEDTLNNEQPQPIQNIFNVTNNSGVVATDAHDFIINNNTTSLEELEKIIEDKISNQDDRKEILSSIAELKEKLENNQPIEKGFLSKIGSKIQKYSWLIAPLADNILSYAFGFLPGISLKNILSGNSSDKTSL